MMRSSASVLLLTALGFGGAPAAWAAKVKVWHHHAPAHHDKAQLKQAVVSSEGALRLARQLRPLVGLDAMHVWDVAEDRDGNLFVATGDEGKLYKVSADGKVTLAYTSPDSQVLCLALGADGTVYAGTGPGGLIVCLPPHGKPRILAEDLDSYVWSLAVGGDGRTLYAGTGPRGRIYRVSPKGKATVFYATKQEHILSLAAGPGGMLYAGTDKNGLVYRIDPRGKGFVLYHAPQSEVRSLLVTPEGVYAGTSTPARGRPGGPGGAVAAGPFTPIGNGAITPVAGKKEDKADGVKPSAGS